MYSKTRFKLSSYKYIKAGITIYLTLMLTVSMALIFTLVESGRASAVNARLRSITYMAADSVFAEFAQPLFDRYGVMFLFADEEGFLNKFNDYALANIDMAGTGIFPSTDLYPMSFNGSEVNSVTWATDRSGAVLTDQICEYMKYHAPQAAAENILSDISFFEQTEETRKSYQQINDADQDYSEYLEAYKNAPEEGDGYEETDGYEDYGDSYEDGDTSYKSPDFIRKVNSQYRLGILDLLGVEISDKGVETKDFPSKTTDKNGAGEEAETFVDKSVKKLLMCEYIGEHMSSYTKKLDGCVLDYEMEYILGGKETDRENLSWVTNRLILLRCGANILSLMMDGEKKLEIQGLAAGVAGWTGQTWLVKLMEMLITFIWALAEAMMDVKGLLEGKKAAILKQKDDWNISVSGLENYSDGNMDVKDNPTGLDYDGYLKLLLMIQGGKTQCFRVMDVMEMNMRAFENPEFRLKDCIAEASVEVSYRAPAVFSALIPSKSRPAAAPRGYSFTFTQEYSYQPA